MLQLKQILKDAHLPQRLLAERLGRSEAMVCELVNHGKWPKSMARETLGPVILDFLIKKGVPADIAACAFEEMPVNEPTGFLPRPAGGERAGERGNEKDAKSESTTPHPLPINGEREPVQTKASACGNRQRLRNTKTQSQGISINSCNWLTIEEEPMLLRKQNITPAAKRLFGLFGDPFADIQKAEEVFLSPEYRYARESLWHTARHGGFMALWGESGAGKSTLKEDFFERINREKAQIAVFQPYVIAMEDSNQKGTPLRATHIADTIISELDPLAKIPRSSQAKFKKLDQLLKASAETGWNHVILIEEAHSLDKIMLKQFKRFLEMKDGFKKLLAVILIGQTELAVKLDERDASVREVVQRCELLQLPPLGQHLKGYLEHRLQLAGKTLDDVMDDAAVEALRAKLTFAPRRVGEPGRSILYPLAVGNVLTAAMNAAAEYGAPKVTAELINEV